MEFQRNASLSYDDHTASSSSTMHSSNSSGSNALSSQDNNDKSKRDRPLPLIQEVSELERSLKTQKTNMSPLIHSNFFAPDISSSSNDSFSPVPNMISSTSIPNVYSSSSSASHQNYHQNIDQKQSPNVSDSSFSPPPTILMPPEVYQNAPVNIPSINSNTDSNQFINTGSHSSNQSRNNNNNDHPSSSIGATYPYNETSVRMQGNKSGGNTSNRKSVKEENPNKYNQMSASMILSIDAFAGDQKDRKELGDAHDADAEDEDDDDDNENDEDDDDEEDNDDDEDDDEDEEDEGDDEGIHQRGARGKGKGKKGHSDSQDSSGLDGDGNKVPPAPWTLGEDITLVQTQAQVGNKWLYISRLIPGRTKAQCKVRFTSIFRASKKEWTSDNDTLLLELLNKYKGDFKKMAEHFPMRTKNAVKLRTRELQRIRKNKGKIKIPPVGSPKQLFFHKREYLLTFFMHTGTHQSYPANITPPKDEDDADGDENAAIAAAASMGTIPGYGRPIGDQYAPTIQQHQLDPFMSGGNMMMASSPIGRGQIDLPVRITGQGSNAKPGLKGADKSTKKNNNKMKKKGLDATTKKLKKERSSSLSIQKTPMQHQQQMLPPGQMPPPTAPHARFSDLSNEQQAQQSHLQQHHSMPQLPIDPQTRKVMEIYSPFQQASASPMLSDLLSKTSLNVPKITPTSENTSSTFVEMGSGNPQSHSHVTTTSTSAAHALPPAQTLPLSDFDTIAAQLFGDGSFILDDNQFANLLRDE